MEGIIKTYVSEKEVENNDSQIVFQKIADHSSSIKIKLKFSQTQELPSFFERKERIYLKAIGNLIKKNDFLKLYIEMLSDQISEEEYEDELEKNGDHYFIELKPISSHFEYFSLIDIMHKFPKKSCSVDDFNDIFGISSEGYAKIINH